MNDREEGASPPTRGRGKGWARKGETIRMTHACMHDPAIIDRWGDTIRMGGVRQESQGLDWTERKNRAGVGTLPVGGQLYRNYSAYPDVSTPTYQLQ